MYVYVCILCMYVRMYMYVYVYVYLWMRMGMTFILGAIMVAKVEKLTIWMQHGECGKKYRWYQM